MYNFTKTLASISSNHSTSEKKRKKKIDPPNLLLHQIQNCDTSESGIGRSVSNPYSPILPSAMWVIKWIRTRTSKIIELLLNCCSELTLWYQKSAVYFKPQLQKLSRPLQVKNWSARSVRFYGLFAATMWPDAAGSQHVQRVVQVVTKLSGTADASCSDWIIKS